MPLHFLLLSSAMFASGNLRQSFFSMLLIRFPFALMPPPPTAAASKWIRERWVSVRIKADDANHIFNSVTIAVWSHRRNLVLAFGRTGYLCEPKQGQNLMLAFFAFTDWAGMFLSNFFALTWKAGIKILICRNLSESGLLLFWPSFRIEPFSICSISLRVCVRIMMVCKKNPRKSSAITFAVKFANTAQIAHSSPGPFKICGWQKRLKWDKTPRKNIYDTLDDNFIPCG